LRRLLDIIRHIQMRILIIRADICMLLIYLRQNLSFARKNLINCSIFCATTHLNQFKWIDTKSWKLLRCATKSLQPFTAKALMPSATETPQQGVVFV